MLSYTCCNIPFFVNVNQFRVFSFVLATTVKRVRDAKRMGKNIEENSGTMIDEDQPLHPCVTQCTRALTSGVTVTTPRLYWTVKMTVDAAERLIDCTVPSLSTST